MRFDWAMRRLLCNKASAVVLEGLLTVLLGEKIMIREFLESEQEDRFDRFHRVDLLVEDSRGQLLIIEIQNNSEYAYFERILFGTSKLVTECVNHGEKFDNIHKIYCVNILYFDLGHGKDYLYRGKAELRGIHLGDLLKLKPFQRQEFEVGEASKLYPEYYILKVNDFVREPEIWLEEWMRYLNTNEIPANATAPGLIEAREMLLIGQMDEDKERAYWRHVENVNLLKSNLYTERGEGRLEGLEEGRAEGIEIGRSMERQETDRKIEEARIAEREQTALKLRCLGFSIDAIVQATRLTKERIGEL
jgi:hypothetical protein